MQRTVEIRSRESRVRRFRTSIVAGAIASLLTFGSGGCPIGVGSSVSVVADGAGITNQPIDAAALIAAREGFGAVDEIFEATPIFNDILGKQGSHSPSLAVIENGDLLAAWYSYDGPRELAGADIYVARWDATAAVWGEPKRVIDRAEAVGNPVLFAEGSRVLLFYAVVPGGWSTAHIEWQASRDNGESWSSPRVLSSQLGSNVRFPPLRMPDGTLLLPAYDDLFQRAVFFESRDDGESWQEKSSIDTGLPQKLIQPSLAQSDGGELVVVGRNTATGALWTGMSTDDGASWQISLGSGFPNPGAPTVLLRLASGNLVMVFNDDPAQRRPLVAAISLDDGQSWTSGRVLADGAGSYSYPSMAQDDDGIVHIVYSDDRERIGHAMVNEAWLLGD